MYICVIKLKQHNMKKAILSEKEIEILHIKVAELLSLAYNNTYSIDGEKNEMDICETVEMSDAIEEMIKDFLTTIGHG